MTNWLLIIAAMMTIIAVVGVGLTRVWRLNADKKLVRERLEALLGDDQAGQLSVAGHDNEPKWFVDLESKNAAVLTVRTLLDRAGIDFAPLTFIWLALMAATAVGALSMLIGVSLLLAAVIGLLVACAPYLVLSFAAERRRTRFVDQLPDALDLMISILRSGLSIPQGIKAVAEEMPSPCGPEFAQVLHRVNLGQSFTEALQTTSDRYQLFELDLVRRATAIQAEVGGSLAELLDKTNSTLRQRIRLKRQVRVLTAQSRLSGTIIALLPFVVGVGFQFLNPGYLSPLFDTNVGKMMLVLALVFQGAGILAIRKMSTFKV
jgi:tight adherence protein B